MTEKEFLESEKERCPCCGLHNEDCGCQFEDEEEVEDHGDDDFYFYDLPILDW